MSNPARPVRLAVAGSSAAYAVALYASGVQLDGSTKQMLVYLPTAAALLVLAFDLWIWKWPLIHKAVNRPRIDGAWLNTLTPSADSHIPPGGNRGPITTAVMIDQTYWSVSATLLSPESRSDSTSAAIRPNGGSRSQSVLAYTYHNEPAQEHRPRSQPHLGASEFHIGGREPGEMSGTYWTARLTAGDMQMRLVSRKTDYPNLAAVLSVAESA
jgi:hypothetical protein